MLPLRDHLPTRRTPIVTYLLIAANIGVFLWERALIGMGYHPLMLLQQWGLVPRLIELDPAGNALTVFSSMFMHDPSGWMHIGGNMLFLWIFGDNVEDAMGSLRYGIFYVLSGIAAAGAQILIDPHSVIPMVGASGAISGVLAAYASLYPRAPITVLNPVPFLWLIFGLFFQLPAWFVILEYFVMNLIEGVGSVGSRTGGVAFFAHIGGFVAGLFLVRLFMAGRSKRDHERWQHFRSSPRGSARPYPPYGPPRDPYR